MKIFKHTFYVEKLGVDNEGNIIELSTLEYTFNFSMTLNGMKLFEDEYGKPLISVLTSLLAEGKEKGLDEEASVLNVIDGNIIRAIAASSYLKIENGAIVNNELSVEEFKELEIYNRLTGDTDFVVGIIGMAIESITDKSKGKKDKNTSKKK